MVMHAHTHTGVTRIHSPDDAFNACMWPQGAVVTVEQCKILGSRGDGIDARGDGSNMLVKCTMIEDNGACGVSAQRQVRPPSCCVLRPAVAEIVHLAVCDPPSNGPRSFDLDCVLRDVPAGPPKLGHTIFSLWQNSLTAGHAGA